MREYSVPAIVEVNDADNLSEVVFRRAAAEPDAVALLRKHQGEWREVSCRRFRDEVVALAKGLVAAGVESGDRVALMSRTRYEWTLVEYAIWAAGAVAVPIYETSSAEQVEWIVGDSGAKAVFVETAEHEATVTEVLDRLPEVRQVWRISDGAIDRLVASGTQISDDVVEKRAAGRVADDLATIVYTSGTTGRPKGCELTHRNLLFDVRNAVAGALNEVFDLEDGSTLLFLPLAHVFAQIIQVGCLESGTVLGHTHDIHNVLPDLAAFRPTFLLAVPRVFEKVYNGAEQKAAAEGKSKIFQIAADTAIAYSRALDTGGPGLGLRLRHALFDRLVYRKLRDAIGGRVRYAVSGASALGERLGHFFRGIGITILEGYGMTETTAATSVNLPSHHKIGTVGRPLPGTAIRIADDGEVLIKGPHVFAGYWGNEKATREVLEPDGWLHTGDLGELDDDGFLTITGRKKEMIITAGGKNVAPAVLEDRLRAHPLVSQCMVVGDGRPFIGCLITLDHEALEQWKAQHGKPADAGVAELRDDPDLVAAIEAAVREANKAVSRAESIRKFRILPVDFTVADGHLTPTLKVKRAVVAAEFADEIEALYA